ncbi:MAG TPA: hypothetical protein VNW92_05635 [Polyangiaceae bacterium]|jgi:hypothetical protein|nr:hypothetical protein [Polyangiaceae bacterium]
MGEIDCLKVCSECSRHVRCSERTCPFCGTALTFFMRVADYRLNTRLGRGATAALGAALGAVGFVIGCNSEHSEAVYGAPCNPPACTFPGEGDAGTGGGAGSAGTAGEGGAAGAGEEPGEGGAAGR